MTTRRSQRVAAALGIASIPLLVAGSVLIAVDIPGEDASGREFVSYFTENTGQIWAGAILSFLGLVAFLGFLVAGLYRVLRRADSAHGGLSGLVLAAGTAWALFTLVGVTLLAGTAGAADFFEGFTLDPDTARLMVGMAWLPSIYGGLAATVVVAASSLSATRTGALPKAFARAGFVAAVLVLIGAPLGFAGFLFALWVLGAGLVLIARSHPETRSRGARTAPPASLPV